MPLVISKGLMRDNTASVKCKTYEKGPDEIQNLHPDFSALGSASVLVVQVKLFNK